ncbi:MAG: nitroreductase family protein [Candidatus Eremiobacteraeota bacterium]|nr:nitroreductase family protein [Candidatus Eremiobacteraeota bacterium]
MLRDLIDERRAYRSLTPFEVTEELVSDLARCAQLAPSCYNNQPWRFVFVYDLEVLLELYGALPEANAWAKASSLIIAVVSRKDLDCNIKEREYFLFDTGMAAAFIILRATERGCVAHPIAGYDEEKAKAALGIPHDMRLITLVVVGPRSEGISPLLNDKQKASEAERPPRLPLEKFAFRNRYATEQQ